MSIPPVDSLDKAFGRLFPAEVMNDLFPAEDLGATEGKRRGREVEEHWRKLRNRCVKKWDVELKRRKQGKGKEEEIVEAN